jgi:sensor histidine kinase YesM
MKAHKTVQPGYWTCQFIGWGLIGPMNILYSASFGQTEKSTHAEQIRLTIWVLTGLLLTHMMRGIIHRLKLLDQSPGLQAIWILSLTLIFALFATIINSAVILSMLTFHTSAVDDGDIHILAVRTILGSLTIFLVWNSIYFLLHYVAQYRNQQSETLRMKETMKDMELKRIKATMNPHFVFNALNSIRALVVDQPILAREAVTSLGNILLSSLHVDKRDTLLLREELGIVNDYLSLQRIRFEERLAVEFDIEPATLDLHIPSMMLQTLVENALKHGCIREKHQHPLRISSQCKDSHFEISVRNPGVLGTSVRINGFGLKSTRERLALLYGQDARLDICQATEDTVEVMVVIPTRASTTLINRPQIDFVLNMT